MNDSVNTPEQQPSVLFVTTVPITLKAFLLPFADHFRAHGWRVDALARAIDGSTPTTSYGPQEAIETTPHFDNTFDIGWSRAASSLRHLLSLAKRVREVVAQGHYDIVHVHTPIASFATRFALRDLRAQARPKVIYTCHGFHFFEGQNPIEHEVFRLMEKRAAAWTDYLVTVNEEDYEAALSFSTIGPSRVRRSWGIGVDTEEYSPFVQIPEQRLQLRSDFGLDSNSKMIAMVAELAPVKRHELAFEAIANLKELLAKKQPHVSSGQWFDFKLVLVGEGPREQELTELAAKMRLANDIVFAGYRTDIDQILCASDVTMLTSKREGLPRVLLESLACATPAVGTNTRGISDAIGDPTLIAGYNDSYALAKILHDVLSDVQGLERRKEEARSRALSRFSLTSVKEFYDELYAQALAERRAEEATR